MLTSWVVCSALGVSREALESPTRGVARVAFARQTAVYLAHVALGVSQARLAVYYRRHHSTISHACQVVEYARDRGSWDAQLDHLELSVQVMAGVCGLARRSAPPGLAAHMDLPGP